MKGNIPPRTIVCKLLNYKGKTRILLKSTSYYIKEYSSRQTLALGKDLWKEVEALREVGKIAYSSHKTIIWREKMKFSYKTNIACLVLIKVNENVSKL